jgi:lysine-N-methylase
MTLPIRHLPVIQNWDCHVCGTCCKEYVVTLSPDEKRRIDEQGWEKDSEIDGMPLFKRSGPPWARRYSLNHRSDGSCVFLSEGGRCRIHERFGYESKPLPCRLFPFVLIPAGDHWRVGMRYACPSAADNKGRAMGGHSDALVKFATELAKREGLDDRPETLQAVLPRLQGRQRVPWPDLFRFVRSLQTILGNRNDRIERRLRKCLALANVCRQARFDAVQGSRLTEFLEVIMCGLDADVPIDPAKVPAPGWVGRILFRQSLALFTRKDYGPNKGEARRSRAALLAAAWRFALGDGPVPRLHNYIPRTTFAAIESASGQLPIAAEEMLERYYMVKVESLQFFGAANFRHPFWDGFEILALTFPVILWVTRAITDLPRQEAVSRALTIVDDHFGFNRVLQTRRQRVSLSLLARTDELSKLIAWYARGS